MLCKFAFVANKGTKPMKIIFLWDLMPCSLVEYYLSFGGNGCIHFQGRRVDESIWYHTQEDSYLHSHHHENPRFFTEPIFNIKKLFFIFLTLVHIVMPVHFSYIL
jgi:hypothetical protein